MRYSSDEHHEMLKAWVAPEIAVRCTKRRFTSRQGWTEYIDSEEKEDMENKQIELRWTQRVALLKAQNAVFKAGFGELVSCLPSLMHCPPPYPLEGHQ